MLSVTGPRMSARAWVPVDRTLTSGLRVQVRPIRPTDREGLRRGFSRLSERSRLRRFLSPMPALPREMLARFTEIDYVDHFAWVALDPRRPADPGIGVGRYIRDPRTPGSADVALAVLDDYQGMGVGTLLLRLLCTSARRNGIDGFTSLVLEDNLPMRRMLSRLGARFQLDSPGVLAFDLDLARVAREQRMLYASSGHGVSGSMR